MKGNEKKKVVWHREKNAISLFPRRQFSSHCKSNDEKQMKK